MNILDMNTVLLNIASPSPVLCCWSSGYTCPRLSSFSSTTDHSSLRVAFCRYLHRWTLDMSSLSGSGRSVTGTLANTCVFTTSGQFRCLAPSRSSHQHVLTSE
ncbi:hypothetical protein J6590_020230, partial [Homalodisca vitripennis]